jgi:DNA polymerase-3 subunit epsilon
MSLIGVVDVETTGFSPRLDRVVEVAVVVVRLDGRVVREFDTLVRPGRDVGASHAHGLTATDLADAPPFGCVAPAIVEALDGCVAFAGHNIRFDQTFLEAEFGRLGHTLPDVETVCTMRLAGGGRLPEVCADYGVPFDGQHRALADARATALLLTRLLADAPPAFTARLTTADPVRWPVVPPGTVPPRSRAAKSQQASTPGYLARLLDRAQPTAGVEPDDTAGLAYTALLDRVLEDRLVSDAEGQALLELATRWGLAPAHIRRLRDDYLRGLAAAALSDGVVTDVERRDLIAVARLLGADPAELDRRLTDAAAKLRPEPAAPVESLPPTDWSGKRVCFTGECRCTVGGRHITRHLAAELAADRGLIVADSVTKKLDVLVVADPHTESGKARTARKYGVRVMHEPVFWAALGVPVG